ncbi:hypothetical protein TRIP_E280219 [uncultured Spirochaetota bacterium]|uniref:Uncharacterized protein n=1 Tax=uncultured Spirochaetota bacterium TaxID=460511 RepID=A0A652ZWS7_9SPIR|nr:hypothetical protein TRIP_E280219 [uncultured Spirochaetota bacterium]
MAAPLASLHLDVAEHALDVETLGTFADTVGASPRAGPRGDGGTR